MESLPPLPISADAEAPELSGQVRATIGGLYRRFRSERAEGTLGDTALEVLNYLDKHGPRTLTELSEAAQVAPASMSQSLNRLTSGGYAERARDAADRRKALFSTTSAGGHLATVARVQRNLWLHTQLSRLSTDDQDVIARACVLLGIIADSKHST